MTPSLSFYGVYSQLQRQLNRMNSLQKATNYFFFVMFAKFYNTGHDGPFILILLVRLVIDFCIQWNKAEKEKLEET